MKKFIFLIFTLFYSNQLISEDAHRMKIFIKKVNIHAQKKEKVFYFQFKNNKLISGKYKTSKNFNELITSLYNPVIQEIINSPFLLKKNTEMDKIKKDCIAETTLEISHWNFYKKIKLCENPYSLGKEEKIILGWINFLMN